MADRLEIELEKTLHEEIPLSVAAGIAVKLYSGNSLILTAPLLANINHKSTAFGGSIFTVAVLAGWGLLHLKLKERQINGHIVIHKSNIEYLMPVTTDFSAQCNVTDHSIERLIGVFKRKKRARIALNVTVLVDGTAHAEFSGQYVIHD